MRNFTFGETVAIVILEIFLTPFIVIGMMAGGWMYEEKVEPHLEEKFK